MGLFRNLSDRKTIDELKLWAELRAGKRGALNEIFHQYYNPLFNYSIRIAGDEDIVKDALQELFIRLWERRKNLSEANSIEAYLLSSVRRILLRDKKSNHKKAEYNRVYVDEFSSVAFSIEEMIIQNELKQEQREQLHDAIQELNNRQKETLFLRYYHGLTSSEISDVMGINPQSVRNHLTRAIASLRLIFKEKNLERLDSHLL